VQPLELMATSENRLGFAYDDVRVPAENVPAARRTTDGSSSPTAQPRAGLVLLQAPGHMGEQGRLIEVRESGRPRGLNDGSRVIEQGGCSQPGEGLRRLQVLRLLTLAGRRPKPSGECCRFADASSTKGFGTEHYLDLRGLLRGPRRVRRPQAGIPGAGSSRRLEALYRAFVISPGRGVNENAVAT